MISFLIGQHIQYSLAMLKGSETLFLDMFFGELRFCFHTEKEINEALRFNCFAVVFSALVHNLLIRILHNIAAHSLS